MAGRGRGGATAELLRDNMEDLGIDRAGGVPGLDDHTAGELYPPPLSRPSHAGAATREEQFCIRKMEEVTRRFQASAYYLQYKDSSVQDIARYSDKARAAAAAGQRTVLECINALGPTKEAYFSQELLDGLMGKTTAKARGPAGGGGGGGGGKSGARRAGNGGDEDDDDDADGGRGVKRRRRANSTTTRTLERLSRRERVAGGSGAAAAAAAADADTLDAVAAAAAAEAAGGDKKARAGSIDSGAASLEEEEQENDDDYVVDHYGSDDGGDDDGGDDEPSFY